MADFNNTYDYHRPVLLNESIEALNIKPNGIYVDVTFGGGGHSRKILEKLGAGGKLVAFDQDADARANLPEDARIIFVQHNFRELKKFLRLHGIRKVDGVLGDLGVSSHQFNEAERGFSYRFDAELDMRMNQGSDTTAQTILNSYTAVELQQIFGEYGEVRNAKTLAQSILAEREMKPIKTIGDFLAILDPCVRGKRNKYLSQVFQALRIEVNDEVAALKDLLTQSLEILDISGRLVIISYHSLEDRLTKNFIKKGNFEGQFIKDFYGNIYRPFKEISKKAIEPSPEEIKINPRARSAKMRIAEKVEAKGDWEL